MKKTEEETKETKSPAPVKKLSEAQQRMLQRIQKGYSVAKQKNIKITSDVEGFYKAIISYPDTRKLSDAQKKWKIVFRKLGSDSKLQQKMLTELTERQRLITEFLQPNEQARAQRQFDELSFFSFAKSKKSGAQDQLTSGTYDLDDIDEEDLQEKQGDQTQQQLVEQSQEQVQQQVQQITKRVRSLGERIGGPSDLEQLQNSINNAAEQRNLTTEQRAIFMQQTKLENIIKSLSKYGDIIGNVDKNKRTIMILGKEYEQDKIIKGIQKLLADVSKISGNVAELNITSKNAPFKKVIKLQKKEQTQFKPTLNQLFQTRKVMC